MQNKTASNRSRFDGVQIVVHAELQTPQFFKNPKLKPFLAVSLVFASVLAVSSLLIVRSLHAEAAVFYPESCLGGWVGTSHAEGKPDVSEGDSGNSFTGVNSAVLSPETGGEIYCGGFSGTIPKDTTPRTLIVSLSAAVFDSVRDEPVVQPVASSTDDFEIPAEIQNVLSATTTEDVIPTETPQGEAVPTPQTEPVSEPASEPVPDVVPEIVPSENIPAPEAPTSLLRLLIPVAYAAEDSVPTEEIPVPETDELIDGTITSVPETNSTVQATDTLAAVLDALPVERPILEVRYTLDGDTWVTLGTLSREQVSGAMFSIPVPDGASWEDVSKIQISVRSLPVTDKPWIYLDGVALSVEYDSTGDSTETLAQDVTEDTDFSLANRFVEDTKAFDGFVYLKTVTADEVRSLYVIPMDEERPVIRFATDPYIAPDSPLGLHGGFVFWKVPDGDVYGYSPVHKKFIVAKRMDTPADGVDVYGSKNLPFGITLRSSVFSFTDAVTGEVNSDDDSTLKDSFASRFVSGLNTVRDDLLQTGLSHESTDTPQ